MWQQCDSSVTAVWSLGFWLALTGGLFHCGLPSLPSHLPTSSLPPISLTYLSPTSPFPPSNLTSPTTLSLSSSLPPIYLFPPSLPSHLVYYPLSLPSFLPPIYLSHLPCHLTLSTTLQFQSCRSSSVQELSWDEGEASTCDREYRRVWRSWLDSTSDKRLKHLLYIYIRIFGELSVVWGVFTILFVPHKINYVSNILCFIPLLSKTKFNNWELTTCSVLFIVVLNAYVCTVCIRTYIIAELHMQCML